MNKNNVNINKLNNEVLNISKEMKKNSDTYSEIIESLKCLYKGLFDTEIDEIFKKLIDSFNELKEAATQAVSDSASKKFASIKRSEDKKPT